MGKSNKSRNIIYNARLECQKTLKNSDISAFSLVNKNDGATFAIYPKGDSKALKQVEQLRMDGRVHMYAEADYTEGTTAYMWICNKISEFAERIVKVEKAKVARYTAIDTPKHLIE